MMILIGTKKIEFSIQADKHKYMFTNKKQILSNVVCVSQLVVMLVMALLVCWWKKL